MKRYLITGASRGIGRAIALRLAASNIELLVHGRDPVALQETCRFAVERGATVVKLVHDLATFEGVAGLVRHVGQSAIDVLINNAGIAVVKPYGEVTPEEWKQTVGVNVTAPFLLMQHFAPRMQPGSSIVNVLSIAAKNAYPNWSVYCASKFALDGLSAAIREELRPRRIRMLNVYPAATDTEIWNTVAGEWPRNRMMSARDVAEAIAFALEQPAEVAIDNITLSSATGAL